MFGGNLDGVPSLRNYAAALSRWEGTKPWRSDSDKNVRPLRNPRRRGSSIRKLNDGSIACRLYSTDVVIYHPSSEITITPWSSCTTSIFANQLIRHIEGLYTDMNTMDRSWLTLRGEDGSDDFITYQIHSAARIWPMEGNRWTMLNPKECAIPLTRYTVDRKKANAALKEVNYKDFEVWLYALEAHNTPVEIRATATATVLQALKNRESWDVVRGTYLHRDNTRDALERLRKDIYKAAGCIVTEDVPFLRSDKFYSWRAEAQAIRASERKWRW